MNLWFPLLHYCVWYGENEFQLYFISPSYWEDDKVEFSGVGCWKKDIKWMLEYQKNELKFMVVLCMYDGTIYIAAGFFLFHSYVWMVSKEREFSCERFLLSSWYLRGITVGLFPFLFMYFTYISKVVNYLWVNWRISHLLHDIIITSSCHVSSFFFLLFLLFLLFRTKRFKKVIK